MSAPSALNRHLNADLPSRCPLCRRLEDESGLCPACEGRLGRPRVEGNVVHLDP